MGIGLSCNLLMKLFHCILIISLIIVQPLIAQEASRRSEIIENYKGQPYYMHFVKQGETVQSLAQLYGVTNVDILQANPEIATGLRPDRVIRIPVKADRTEPKPQVQDQGDGRLQHEVMPKETWYGIARMYKVPVKDLIQANADVDTLKIGMKIFIPGHSTQNHVITGNYAEHTVRPQETLYSLAKRYNTTVEELQRLNTFLADGLKVGQVLMVPVTDTQSDLKLQVTDTAYIGHIVQKKETLYSIAKQYGIDQQAIIKANPSFNGKLNKGDVLRIPVITKEVKPFTRPDTVILGRQINQAAEEGRLREPCSRMHVNTKEYHIALLVPMQLELVDSIRVSDPAGLKSADEYSAFDFIQFYEGALIAADSMARAGMKVKVHVFDADYGSDVHKTRKILLKPEMAGMDLIIGPFFAESFSLVAEFAKKNQIAVVNPLSRRSEITKGNEFIIKMQPSGWAQYNALGKYLANAHHSDNIIIVKRNDEENSNIAKVLKSAFLADSINPVRFKEVVYSSGGWSSISNNLSSSKPNMVVILTSDKAVLPALLRDLAEKANTHYISVVGLPEWEDMELDYNYLMKLNTHFFRPWFVDYESAAAKHFIRSYRERFAGEPELEKHAYLGYDATLYFLQALQGYGNGFLSCLESLNNKGLSSDFIFLKSPGGGFENFGTAVFKYTDFKRERLN